MVFNSYFLSTSKVHNYNARLFSRHAHALPNGRIMIFTEKANIENTKKQVNMELRF